MRLLPRFSLRFALIALTIFLIVFGFAVNIYQRFHAHEQIAAKLQLLNYDVEEETSMFGSYVLRKKLVGLDGPRYDGGTSYLVVLREIPRPRELLRFGYRNPYRPQDHLDLLLAEIERFSNLQELYLEELIFTHDQVAKLGAFTQLRVLSLKNCNIPPDGLKLLARMPQLETLQLEDSKFQAADLLAQPLPALRVLDLSHTPVTELPLTKAGWGRSPNLEKILLRQSELARVTCEAGALPKLRQLDLAYQGATRIDWPALPAAAPNLDTLAMHIAQISEESAPVLRQFSKLRYLHFNQEPVKGVAEDQRVTVLTQQSELPPLGVRLDDIVIPVAKEALARDLVKDRPQLLFCRDYAIFHDLIAPPSANDPYGHPWISVNWRPTAVADPFASARPTPPPPFPLPLSSDPLGVLPEVPATPAIEKPFGPQTPVPADPSGDNTPSARDPLDSNAARSLPTP